MLTFTIKAKIPGAQGRAGSIETPHGTIETPAFIPVGTKATIKSLTPEQVASLGADAILANTYHLYLQPGTEVLAKAGGLGKFMNWKGPTFTDSGGFQAFSLGPAFGGGSKINGGKDEAKKDMGSDTLHSASSASIAAGPQAGTRVSEPLPDEAESAPGEAESVRLAKIDDDGVTFKSIIDGSTHRFTPERSIEIQQPIGADIIFAFDECLSPQESYEKQKAAVERTHAWAERCLIAHNKAGEVDSFSGRFGGREGGREPAASPAGDDGVSRKISSASPALFGIVQGGRHEDLRRYSAKPIGAMNFDGFGIGGSFDKDDIGTAVGWVCEELPENKPRHLLGIGEPEDLILGIENGIDTFDCVAPTRIARNGAAYVKGGRINLFNAQFVSDFSPLEKDCGCYTCTNYTKAYLAHLFRAKEMLAATLTSIHNLYFLVHLVKDARKAIVEGTWEEFKHNHR